MRPAGLHPWLARLGVAHPIVQAPMAGGATTPELVAAVCEAGALGSFAAATTAPRAILEACAAIRARTERPFAVNLFVLDEPPPADDPQLAAAIARVVELLAPMRAELGLPAAQPMPARFCERGADQLAAVREARPAVASFAFGVLPPEEVRALQAVGTAVVGTATHVAEALAWQEAGADAVCAQGSEAGGHRGTFIGAFEDAMIGTMALVPQVVRAVRIPVIAAGGIMNGAGIAAAMALGATAAQLGTAFLPCPESGVVPAWKQAVLAGDAARTTVTRTFSGRPARGIVNDYIRAMTPHAHELPAYPVTNALTAELRAAAGKAGRGEFLSLWAGQAVALARAMPAGELVTTLAREWSEAHG